MSAGFAVATDDWHGNHRRVRRALLDHVALVAEVAYPSATITAVRSNTPS